MTETTNTGLDSAYVKEQLGDVLTDLLSELVQVQPSDPIEWLANALRQHARAQTVSPFIPFSCLFLRSNFRLQRRLLRKNESEIHNSIFFFL